MKFILPRTQKNFDSVAGTTVEKLFCVHWQNKPWPEGLRNKSTLSWNSRLTVAPLRSARLFQLSVDLFQQQNLNIYVNRA